MLLSVKTEARRWGEMAASSSSSKPSKFGETPVVDPTIDHKVLKGDDVELWSIRVPPGFDVAALDGVTIGSNGATTVRGADGASFTLQVAPAAECEPVVSAFPSAKKGRWLLAKSFSRQYVLTAQPPGIKEIAAQSPPPLPPVPQLTSLRMRNPFNSTLREQPNLAAPIASVPTSSRKRGAETEDKAKSSSSKKSKRK